MKAIYIAATLVVAACSTEHHDARRARPQARLSGARPGHMRNCPSSVSTAVTKAEPVIDGVELAVTSTDESARREIVARTALQAALGDTRPMIPGHTGMHGGPGSIGFCPIIHASTTVAYEETSDGVRIRVKARDPRDVAALQRATAARVGALTQPSS